MTSSSISALRRVPLEAAIWIGGLSALYFVSPEAPARLDLCLFHRLGLGPCPGCGLGASIHHLLHGNVAASWNAHPLGIPALAVLAARTIGLLARPVTGGLQSLRSKGARQWQT